jgi:YVTN family beta-propeller protein
VGKVQVFDAKPPFALLRTIDTGPITNHVNFARTAKGQFAYVTVGGLNEVKVFRTDNFAPVATIPVGEMPHGIWPSGDGRRIYVGLENADRMAAIDTASNKVIASVAIGQAPQAIAYVPEAVASGDGTASLVPLGLAGQTMHLTLGAPGSGGAAPTSVSLYDQGILQVLQAAVTGLPPGQSYLLALSARPDGGGALDPLARFKTNPAGAAIVSSSGPIRQIVRPDAEAGARRYLVIVKDGSGSDGAPLQVQRADTAP